MAEPVDVTLDALSEALGHRFADTNLLELALTHRSWCAENEGAESNERLEFLGDAVLGLAVTDELFAKEPDQSEGQLAKARAEVVNAVTLARLARRLDLGSYLRLGRGELLTDGREKESILADATEAVIGAIYLDAGWSAAQGIVLDLIRDELSTAQATPGIRDYKTRLQERAAEHGLPAPKYTVASTGPDHDPVFSSTVTVGSYVGAGRGSSKKQAHQRAAEDAISQLAVRASVPQTDVPAHSLAEVETHRVSAKEPRNES